MHLSQAAVEELARCWLRLYRSAAEPHLELMISQRRRSGDPDGAADYARILRAVRLGEEAREAAVL